MKDIAQALKFVKGSVAKKDYVPELTHFRIKDGNVMGFNGKLALSHPVDLDMDIIPKAVFFEKALAALPVDVPVALDLTATGRLALRAGGFKVFVPCLDLMPEGLFQEPQGEVYDIALGLIETCEALFSFIAEDASRPWAQSIMLKGQSAFATNNQIVVERWCQSNFPEPFTLPLDAVRELIRIGIEPSRMQLHERSVTFHYTNGAWMRTQLLSEPWPERLAEVMATPTDKLVPVPDEFSTEVKRLAGFIEDSGCIHVLGATLSTTKEENAGASVVVSSEIGDGVFHIETLKRIAAVATHVDFWSVPAVFRAPGMRGVAMNMRG